jgi:hypothetical protein
MRIPTRGRYMMDFALDAELGRRDTMRAFRREYPHEDG